MRLSSSGTSARRLLAGGTSPSTISAKISLI